MVNRERETCIANQRSVGIRVSLFFNNPSRSQRSISATFKSVRLNREVAGSIPLLWLIDVALRIRV